MITTKHFNRKYANFKLLYLTFGQILFKSKQKSFNWTEIYVEKMDDISSNYNSLC